MNRLLHNSKILWVISIVVAILLWMYVVTDQNPRTFDTINDIPVEFINEESLEAKGLVITDPQDYTVDIRVYGRRNQLYSLNRSVVKAHIDVSELNNKGTHYLPIVITGIPTEVDLSRKDPDAIQITLDAIVNQPKDIGVIVTGEPAGDVAAMPYEIDQNTAHLDGPEEILNQVDQVVAYIDISDANEDIHRTVPLMAIDSSGQEVTGMSIMPENVDITIPIKPTKRVPITPDIIGQLPQGYEVMDTSITPSTVQIVGDQDELDQIDNIQTEEISMDEATQSFEREVELILPEGILLVDSDESFTLSVTLEEYTQEEIEISDIDIINLDEDLIVDEDMTDIPITITVSGIENQITSLGPQDISLSIDASDLGEGEHQVTIQVDLPDGISLEDVSPDTVTFNIQEEDQENQEDEE